MDENGATLDEALLVLLQSNADPSNGYNWCEMDVAA